MRFTHYHQFDGLDEVKLVIHYDYEEAEPAILYGDDAYPGWPENALISAVHLYIGDDYSAIIDLITEDFMAELVEHCLEDYRGGE